MTLDPHEVLSMLIDGETAPAEDLVEALSRPDAAQTLLSFAQLRATVAADTAMPGAKVAEAIETASREPARLLRFRRPLSTLIPAALAGAAAAAAAILVFRPAPPPGAAVEDGPPRPELVVRFALDEPSEQTP